MLRDNAEVANELVDEISSCRLHYPDLSFVEFRFFQRLDRFLPNKLSRYGESTEIAFKGFSAYETFNFYQDLIVCSANCKSIARRMLPVNIENFDTSCDV